MTNGARPKIPWLVLGALVGGLAGCEGPQSALKPAGADAERIAALFAWMAGGAILIWATVLGVAVYAVIKAKREHAERPAKLFVIGGGVVLPSIVVTVLVVGGLSMLPDLLELGPGSKRTVRVSAEQWWWRVGYELPDGSVVELANELRFPVGERTSVAVSSPDVVHSFWIPSLAGKVDAIPGRVTYIGIEPTRAGTFRGVCAEYCGSAHAMMAFSAISMKPAEYRAWLKHQAEPAELPRTSLARAGQMAFLRHGCDACHTVRGTSARGRLGPDLTHVGSRTSIAGVLDNDVSGFTKWLEAPGQYKPHVKMPGFDMVPDEDVAAMAAYLEGLQ